MDTGKGYGSRKRCQPFTRRRRKLTPNGGEDKNCERICRIRSLLALAARHPAHTRSVELMLHVALSSFLTA
jgi:hypothetical protein